MKWGVIASCLGIAIPALAIPAALVWAAPACADSWLPPSTQTYLSPNRSCRLTVVPREIDSSLGYFEDKVAGKEPAGQRPGGVGIPNATLERRGADGKWTVIWRHLLVNEVAPTSALISSDGRYVVTFDNWHSVGWGDTAIVIYDTAKGGERRMSVEQLVGPAYFKALPRSVSSIHWRGDARFEGGQLVIDIIVPNEEPVATPDTVALIVDPATGAMHPPNAAAWTAARAIAERIHAEILRHEAERRAARAAPLLAPKLNDEPGWHEYLREAFARVDPDWIEGSASTTVLRAPNAPDYAASVPWIADALHENREETDIVMFAGMDEPALLGLLERELARLAPGTLGKARIYVAASAAAHARIRAMFAGKGGRVILLDPAKGIPQRPERMPRADGSLPSAMDFQN